MRSNTVKLNRLLCILTLLLVFAMAISCFFEFCSQDNDAFAFSDSNIGSASKVSELLLDGYADRNDGKVFNAVSMGALYDMLTGRKNSDLDDVEALGTLTAKQIRSNNGNQDIVLQMDNKQWTVTHLTKDTDGNIIATLWLASSMETCQWNTWADSSSIDSSYPSNMYSSSYIRAVALNSGRGYAASKDATSLTPVTQNESHQYAKFTMTSVKGSLTSFISTPSKVTYQSNQNHLQGGTVGDQVYTLPNEAWGTPSGVVNWCSDINMKLMLDKDGYSEWMNDYIWLPSLTEAGQNSSVYGIWELSDNQRANNSYYSWTRTGRSIDFINAYALIEEGNLRNFNEVTSLYAVRPAFHLNLSAADSSSASTLSVSDFKVTYDGTSKSISSASWYNKDKDIYSNTDKITVTYSDATRTDAGEYTVTLTIKDSSLVWADAKSSEDNERTCKMNIEKAEPTVNPIIGTGQLYPGSNMPSITLSSGDTSGSIAWDDSKIVEGKTTYNWTFTSSNSNYKDKTGSATLTISGIEVNAIEASITLPAGTVIYTSTSVDSLKSYLTVTKKNNNGTSAGTAGQSEYSLSGSLNAGKSTITVTLSGTSITTTFEVDVTAVALASITASITSGNDVFTTTPLDDIKAMLTVTGTNNDGSTVNVTSDKYTLSCDNAEEGGTLPSGSQTLKLTLNSDSSITCNVTVQVGEPNILRLEVSKLDTFPTTVYDITPLNTLKQYLKVIVTYADADGTKKELAGKDYTIEGTLTAGKTNTLTIKYGGKSSTISVTGVISVTVINIEVVVSQSGILYSSATQEDIKGCLIVTATYNNGTDDVLTAEGYEVVIPQGFSSVNNKVTIKCGDKSAEVELEVTDVVSTGIEVEYTDGGEITVDSALQDLLSGIKLTLNYNDGTSKGITPTIDMLSGSMDSIGDKTITVTYTDPEDSSVTHSDTFTVNVGKGTFDMSGVKFEDKTVTRDGNTHTLEIEGELPEGVSVTYSVEGQSGTSFAEVGEYVFTAMFTHSNANYNDITSMSAKLTISEDEFDVNSLVFEDTVVGYDGKPHSIEIENAPEWLTVEYEGNGQTEIGSYVITAKFTHNNPNYGEISPITATLTIEKGKIAKPVYKGDIRYSGESILPDVNDFEGYTEGVIEIVIEKSEAGVFVGKYTIVFAIVDTEHYEWDNGNSASVLSINRVFAKGNAVLVLTDSITLEDNEIAVEWSIGKAKLTATKKDGALPVFSSTSYKGSMDEVITYKYYTDKECTEEIAQEEIVAGQTYYVKASLEDSDNFELDATAIKFVGTSFSYDAPVGELSTGEKIVQFLKKNWLWLVIALVALLILIIIIVLIARRKKDDNNGKGNNNPPYPPYNGGGQPPYPPYNGGQPPYPPYGDPYGGQPYYMRRPPVMPMAGMIQPQGGMRPMINGAMQPQIGMQQPMQPQLQGAIQMQSSQPQIQTIAQPSQVQYVEKPALNAPHSEDTHLANALTEEISRLRGEVEHIKSKSEEDTIKLRSELENARTMSAVESAKMQAMAEIERAKNEAKFAMHSGNISEAAATTISGKAGAGDVLGDALMSAVVKMIVQGSINGAANNATVTPTAQPIHDNANANTIQNNASAIPQCPPGGRVTTTTMVDMTNKNSRQAQFSTDDSFM